ncbi:hypothetical protein GFS31_28440 [Leptolyngbya sp. BL0902]|uniref:Npun_F0494 family protein n=1 Tax=Leptolyngbya sp. BL0902 TaxID=1115757 RepID=UPI0018E901DA|nr:Npun_F0494 family protein [Leptolyngbya sp. BL0902]QQE66146.1 hypothetical protein GFS31_28440 [Leptolyngbya sp. BL0902]
MALVNSDPSLIQRYPQSSWRRAERAFKCSPFRLDLLITLRHQSVSVRQVCHPQGVTQGYTRRSLSELQADNELMWLIAVGLLRREVDGQGLTDSFRLTPLGHHLCHHLEQLSTSQLRPTWGDHLHNTWHRWLRLPSWWQG